PRRRRGVQPVRADLLSARGWWLSSGRAAVTIATRLPAALLAIVASVQIVLAHRGGMTPWKGGGLGMFSTLDHGAFRGVDIVIDAPDRSEAQAVPASLETLAARASTYPADWLLAELAKAIAARERRYERPVTRVTLTVWRTAFDPVTLAASEQTL